MADNRQLDATYTALVQADPEIQRLLSQFQQAQAQAIARAGGRVTADQLKQAVAPLEAQFASRLAALGIPNDGTWQLQRQPDGSVGIDHQNFAERHPELTAGLIAGGVFGAGTIAPALMGGGAGATGAGAGGALPVTSAGAGLGTPVALGAPAGMAPSVAAGGSAFTRALDKVGLTGKDAFGAGLSIAGQYFQNRADAKAREEALAEDRRRYEEAKQREDAMLGRAGDMYNQQRSDFQNLAGTPYGTLGSLLGMNIAPITPLQGIGTDPRRLAAQRSGAPMLQLPGKTLADFTRA